MIQVEKVEEIVEAEIMTHLTNLKNAQANKVETDNPELNALKIQAAKIDEQIERLINQVAEGSDITNNYLNQAISKLHGDKRVFIDKINDIQLKMNRGSEIAIDIDEVISNWFDYEIDVKKAVAKKIIEKVILEGEEINIIFY